MYEQVKRLLVNALDIDEEIVTEGALLEEDLMIDSLDVIELSIEIESEFDIVIEDREVENIKTVSDLCSIIEKKLSEKEQG